ncbi:CysS/YqeB C-terminal domain-containing protein [Parenemella sanctibonifatiensis]
MGTGDPREGQYATWVEGDPELPEAVQALLAARRRAGEDKRRCRAEELAGQLAGGGVVVRDRRGTQQVRRLNWHVGSQLRNEPWKALRGDARPQ